ncbi:T9SS type A sorting domain-containing protein [Algoriella sp.]|uniref:T9SS type A sorting domain-containing protein n=1 Tax=Algoriella sp. TaxID=1872434 RepID=UPI001B25E7F8|nr:T9SS type A sorting domain-containing protein [Algoriella sp.]MBO6211495.1 T9SS type A sorting domain-containing protein [Algoriella sp.]
MKKTILSLKTTLFVTFFVTVLSSNAQVYMLGNPSADFQNTASAASVSNDGKVIGLTSYFDNFYWNAEEGITKLGQIYSEYPDYPAYTSGIVNITQDGKKGILYSENPADNLNQISIFYFDTKQWEFLASSNQNYLNAETIPYGISPDGSIIGGMVIAKDYSYAKGIYWTKDKGIQEIGSVNPARYSGILDINDDGKTSVGYQDQETGFRQGTYWKEGKQTLLNDNQGNPLTAVAGVSGNGKWILGSHDNYAMKWSEENGVVDIIHPNTSDDFRGTTRAANYDGSIILGSYDTYTIVGKSEGFMWTEKTGFILLNDLVKKLGYDDLGINFQNPFGISANGKYIVGLGTTEEGFVSFKIALPDDFLNTKDIKTTLFDVYPNPVENTITINTTGNLKSAELFDLNGKRILSKSEFKTSKTIDVNHLPKGVYILKVNLDGKDYTKKIVKK